MAKIDCSKAVNFILEKDRMCSSYIMCADGCPLRGRATCDGFMVNDPELAVDIVQKWSDEHPAKGGATGKAVE